jgi:hypothetical protein
MPPKVKRIPKVIKRPNKDINKKLNNKLIKSSMSDEFYKFITSDRVKQLISEAVKFIIYTFIAFAAAETFGRVGGEVMGRRIATDEAMHAEENRLRFENTLRELNISPIQAENMDLRFAEATAEVIPQRATTENITGAFYY